jgi:predicted tellurium resistance membrane protein TerC
MDPSDCDGLLSGMRTVKATRYWCNATIRPTSGPLEITNGDTPVTDYLLALAADPAAWVALATLIAMEVVLGIDNLIFISILTNKLPEHQRERARRLGIGAAMLLRLGLLGTVAIIVQLTDPVFTAFGHGFSWRDLILIAGGLFLVWKATKEIHHNVDPDPGPDMFDSKSAGQLGFTAAIGQILLLDLVFSVDSIITAVGMTEHIPIMVIAVVVTVAVMLLAATPLANFIASNPTIVMLALGFLLMIGMTLIAEGFGAHVPKGYIYAAMAFSALIEGLNMLSRRAGQRKRAAPAQGSDPASG